MPVHDWKRVDPGIFHDFHTVWIGHIRTILNSGLLPQGYYALAEQLKKLWARSSWHDKDSSELVEVSIKSESLR